MKDLQEPKTNNYFKYFQGLEIILDSGISRVFKDFQYDYKHLSYNIK